MKVAVVSTARSRGGAARIAFTLAKGIKDLDPRISITFYHAQDNQQSDWIKGLKQPYLGHTNALLARLGGARWVFDGGFASRVVAETQDADVLHIHNLHGYYLDYEKLLKAWRDRPIVWTWHDMWGATGRCGYSLDCDQWKKGCPVCPHKDYYPAAWFDRSASEFAAKTELFSDLKRLSLVSPSQWLADIATTRQITMRPVEVIPNPVDANLYRPVESREAKTSLHLDPEKRYLLFIAADCNNRNKGYDDFVHIIEKGQFYGVVVGIPPEQRCDRIVYAGAVNDAERLSQYYSAADLMLITSKQDNYPNTVMESMACGTPVMGYGVGGIPSQMPESWDGIVPLNDVHRLYAKANQYLEDGGKTSALQTLFRTHIEAHGDLRVISAKYLALFRSMAESC